MGAQSEPAARRTLGAEVVEQIKAVCRMCHGGCGTIVERVNGTIRKVIGDKANPINRGALCSKAGTPSVEQLYHPGRLDYPLMRVGARGEGRWKRISWDEALDRIADRWREIITTDGAAAILPYSYLGSMGTLSAFGTMHALFHRIGATRLERTICGGQNQDLTALVGATWTDPENIEDAR